MGSHWKDIKLYVLDPFHLGQQAFESINKSIYSSLVLCIMGSHWKDIKLYVLDPFHLGQQAFESINKSIYSSSDPQHPQKEHLLI